MSDKISSVLVAVVVCLAVAFGGSVLVASCEEQNHGYHYPAGE